MIQIIHINLQLTPKKPAGLDTWEPGFSAGLNRMSKLRSSFDILPHHLPYEASQGSSWRQNNEVCTVPPEFNSPLTKPAISD